MNVVATALDSQLTYHCKMIGTKTEFEKEKEREGEMRVCSPRSDDEKFVRLALAGMGAFFAPRKESFEVFSRCSLLVQGNCS